MTQAVLVAAQWLNIQGLVDLINDWQRNRARKAMERRTYKELQNLSDHELRDLGIGRSDIRSISMGTFYDKRMSNLKTNDNLKGWV
jgi:uncharacterized protein YjiS (DUF1127 family)|tara:strand:+ start:221 stop:478 length:258 start_codon:yes stop_codon:yes gene_type:complete